MFRLCRNKHFDIFSQIVKNVPNCIIIVALYGMVAIPSPSQGRGRWNWFHVTVIGYWRLALTGCGGKLDYDGRNRVSGELQTNQIRAAKPAPAVLGDDLYITTGW